MSIYNFQKTYVIINITVWGKTVLNTAYLIVYNFAEFHIELIQVPDHCHPGKEALPLTSTILKSAPGQLLTHSISHYACWLHLLPS